MNEGHERYVSIIPTRCVECPFSGDDDVVMCHALYKAFYNEERVADSSNECIRDGTILQRGPAAILARTINNQSSSLEEAMTLAKEFDLHAVAKGWKIFFHALVTDNISETDPVLCSPHLATA